MNVKIKINNGRACCTVYPYYAKFTMILIMLLMLSQHFIVHRVLGFRYAANLAWPQRSHNININTFISSPTHNTISRIRPTTLTLSSSSFNEDGPSPAQKKQEKMMEQPSHEHDVIPITVLSGFLGR